MCVCVCEDEPVSKRVVTKLSTEEIANIGKMLSGKVWPSRASHDLQRVWNLKLMIFVGGEY